MMLSESIYLAANQVTELSLSGNYFELRAAPSVVSVVELLTRDGGVVSTLEEVEATDKVKTPRKFDKIRFTNGAAAQTIRVYYGEGETGSNRFTGVVSGQVSLDAATLAALESVSLNPVYSSGHYETASNYSANTPEIIFTAAANTGGAVILSAFFEGVSAVSNIRPAFIAKATAPAGVLDGEVVFNPPTIGIFGGAYFSSGGLLQRQYLPAGVGLYIITNISATQCLTSCRYRLL